jgi:tetratricopeptide (TPR) repeat protein
VNDDAPAAKGKAQVLADAGLHDQALPLLSAHLAANPADAEALSLLGECLAALGRGPEAVEVAKQAVACDPEDPKLHTGLAWIALSAGQPALAHAAVANALGLEPDDWEVMCAYVAVTYNVSDKLWRGPELARQRQRAHAVAIQALEAEPDEAQSHAVLGFALLDLGQVKRADEAFARALALDPGNAHFTAARALSAAKMKRHAAAAQAASALMAVDPTAADYRVILMVAVFGAVNHVVGIIGVCVIASYWGGRYLAEVDPPSIVNAVVGVLAVVAWATLIRSWRQFRGSAFRRSVAMVKECNLLAVYAILGGVGLLVFTAAPFLPMSLSASPPFDELSPLMLYVRLVSMPLAVACGILFVPTRRAVIQAISR